jgi:uncharacterized repeat protein (TIGR03803 family)
MLQAGDGNFYSLSRYGQTCTGDSSQYCSYIYRIALDGTVSVFHTFPPVPTSAGNTGVNSDGYLPVALIFGTDGNFYGACQAGGPGGLGTIFQITPAGQLSVLKSFGVTANNADPGSEPNSLIQGADGNFYFTNGIGVYQLTLPSSLSTIFAFPSGGSKGGNASSIVQGGDGNFYLTLGTAPVIAGAAANFGAIAQLTLGGQLTILHSFATDGSEGNQPSGPLVQASDGNLYGVSQVVINTVKTGVAYDVSPGGTFSLLHSFTDPIFSNWDSGLFVGSDGNLYGTTLQGGDIASANCAPRGCGAVYQMTPSGTVSTLHKFEGGVATSTVVSQNPQVDGAGPTSPLVQGPGGLFYGAAVGSAGGSATVFSLTLNPAIPAPVQLIVNPKSVFVDTPVQLTWKVLNAFSQTQQQCGATVTGSPSAAGGGAWTGPQAGKLVNGVYSGSATIAPTAAGTYTYALTCGGKESGFATLVVLGNTPLQIQTLSLQKGTVPQQYLQILSVNGGVSPYTWTVAGGLPKGLAFNPAGVLTGIPTQFGLYHLAFQVSDSTTPNPQTESIALDLTVDSGLTLFTGLPNPLIGQPYSQAISASGGLTPYTFKLVSGALPPGLQFNATAGVISGTATQAGQASFDITVTDSENPKAMVTQTFSLTTGAKLEITSPGFLPDASVGIPFSTSLTAVGGTGPYFWSLGDNTGPYRQVPQGLTLSTAGVLAGTPIQWNPPGSYDSFDVVVTDSENPPVSVHRVLGITCKSTLQILTNSLPVGRIGVQTDTLLMATGGIPPYKWTAQLDHGEPNLIGLYLNDGNDLVYLPLQTFTGTVTLTVQDSEKAYAFVQVALPLTFLPALFPTTTTLASSNAAAGTGESVTFTATVVQTGAGPAAGQVVFNNGTMAIGTATLDVNGNATLQTSFSTAGVFSVTAVYGGSGTLASSVSAAVTETVVTPTISTVVNPGTLTVKSGSSGKLEITLTPVGDYSGTVNFSCGTLPAHVSCSFAPPSLTIASGSGPVTDVLTVSTNAPLTAMLLERRNEGTGNDLFVASTFWLPGPLAGMVLLVCRRRKRVSSRNFWMAAMLCLFCVAGLSSCASSPSKAAAGTYKIPVVLTVSGGATQNISTTIIVQ